MHPSIEERRSRAQKAAARIRELQKDVKPDPEVRDYINFGRGWINH
jgi:hypothetical protein